MTTLIKIEPAKEKKSPAKRAWYRDPRVIRHGVMLFFFLFLLHVAYDHQVKGGGPKGTPSVEAYCPFGGVENLYYFLTTGGYIRRIEPSAMILMGALILLTLIFSRGFCGWICPFGSVQEWIGMLGKKIFGKRFNPTGSWDRALKYLKYVILAVIVGFTWHLGTLVFRPYDPFLAFFHLGEGIDEMPWAYSILWVVLVGSLIIERFFCKYACPLGAVIGIIGKLGITKVVRDETDCKGCNICQKKCFTHVDFLATKTIQDAECNHCLDCTVHCPKPNVLTLKGWRWSFSHSAYAAALVLGLFVFIGVSQATNHWRTKPELPTFRNAAGQLDANEIRGWMTLKDISDTYKIPLQDLYAKAGIPAKVDPNTRMNKIGSTYELKGFEPDSMRTIVAGMVGGSAPQTAKPAEKKAPEKKSGEKKAGEKKDHPGGEEQEVKGFMTLNEIAMKTGVPKEYFVKSLQLSGEIDGRKPVREWMHAQGKSIQDLRDAVTAYRAGKR
ncbi:MAG: 4Fe-4S binding protein [Bryobacter sp.]|nr:4Fe-4S binding protein [Bryobacter sp.]